MANFQVNESVTIPAVTTSSDGLMSASDKTKLDGITNSGGGGIDLIDEGIIVRPSTGFLDFRGSGVVASSDGIITITGTSAGVASFNTRTGDVTPQQADYDAYFLTPAEGNAAYLTQEKANAQGMPAVELGAIGSGLPITRINADTALLPATEGSRFWQFYFNIDTASHNATLPGGWTLVGSAAIAAGTGALFLKAAGAQTFYRVN